MKRLLFFLCLVFYFVPTTADAVTWYSVRKTSGGIISNVTGINNISGGVIWVYSTSSGTSANWEYVSGTTTDYRDGRFTTLLAGTGTITTLNATTGTITTLNATTGTITTLTVTTATITTGTVTDLTSTTASINYLTGVSTSWDQVHANTITLSALNNTTVGGTTPAAGAFTTLKASTDPTDGEYVGDRDFNDARYPQVDYMKGFLIRPKFEWVDKDTIKIYPGSYHIAFGTTRKIVTWDSVLTYDFGPGGSNANSDALSSSTMTYLYLDHSVIVSGGTEIITSAMFINKQETPYPNENLRGEYHGFDRCVLGVWAGEASGISRFWHDGGRKVRWDNSIEDYPWTDVDTTWVDVTLTIPVFATLANISLSEYHPTAILNETYIRPDGSSGTSGIVIKVYDSSGVGRSTVVLDIHTSSAQGIELKNFASNTHMLSIRTNGYYLPRGM